jgi:hypothetical protein
MEKQVEDLIPTMHVTRGGPVWKGEGTHVTFTCPKCKNTRTHGLKIKSDSPEHRGSHCLEEGCWPDGYYIVS